MTEAVEADARERLRILAHELRSPVAALSALVEAAPHMRSPEDRRRLVEIAVAAGRDVDRLLTDPELLSLRRRPVGLAALVEAVAVDGVDVRVHADTVVEADPTRIRQALANLVANGLRHGTRVAIEVDAEGGRGVVLVSDDGPGVEPGFDPFARGAGTEGSTGYGLWIARAVAQAHGGSLDLVRDDRPGARFRLALPSASAGR